MNTLLPATVRHAAVSFLAVVHGSSSTSMCAWHKQNPTTLTGIWSIGSLSDQQIQQEPKSMDATWQAHRRGESFKNKMDIFLSFLGCLFHPVLLYLIDPHVLPGTMPHRIHLHKAGEVKRMLINMIISSAEEQCGWMMSLKKLLNVLSVIYIYIKKQRGSVLPSEKHNRKPQGTEWFCIVQISDCCAAVWLITWHAGCRVVRRLKMADSWRPRHHWFFYT